MVRFPFAGFVKVESARGRQIRPVRANRVDGVDTLPASLNGKS
jgi:hypothetical protein